MMSQSLDLTKPLEVYSKATGHSFRAEFIGFHPIGYRREVVVYAKGRYLRFDPDRSTGPRILRNVIRDQEKTYIWLNIWFDPEAGETLTSEFGTELEADSEPSEGCTLLKQLCVKKPE